MAFADDLLNGSDSAPRYGYTDPTMPTRPSEGTTTGVTTPLAGNPRAVMVVWILTLVLLVAAHVLTLKIQR